MLENLLQDKLKQFQDYNLIRKRVTLSDRTGNTICTHERSLINFTSNDYLGLSQHPRVKQAFIKGIEKFGVGSTSSPQISGFYTPQAMFEEQFAAFVNQEQAILFNSGYHANLGVLTTLANRHDTFIADKLCHASLIDGMQLSRATCKRYAHQQIAQVENLLANVNAQALLLTESVFSMEGDIAPINQLAKLAKKYHAALIVDDAHGFGFLGEKGRGIVEHFALDPDDLTCLLVPLGKSLGSMGGIAAGKKTIMEPVLQFARTYRYSTALPPAVASASLMALNLIETENWRIDKLKSLIKYFIVESKARNLPLLNEELTPVKSILIGDNQKTLQIQATLEARGFFISCIRPPTVPLGTARIRISLNALHEESMIVELLDYLTEAYEQSE